MFFSYNHREGQRAQTIPTPISEAAESVLEGSLLSAECPDIARLLRLRLCISTAGRKSLRFPGLLEGEELAEGDKAANFVGLVLRATLRPPSRLQVCLLCVLKHVLLGRFP